MSTKIHYGFQLRARDIRQVLDEFASVQKKAEEILKQRQSVFIAVTAASRLDRLALFGLPGYTRPWGLTYSAISTSVEELDDRQHKVRRTQRRDPDVDFEVFFRLWLSRDTNTFIGIVRAEGAEDFRKILFEAGFADEFAYWNNTDPEEGFTDEQWDARGAVWNGVLAGKSGPWFDIQVEEPINYHRVTEAVLAALPTFEQRVANHARTVAFTTWEELRFARHLEKGEPRESAVVTRFFDFLDKLQEGDAEVTEIQRNATAQVRNRLAPEITKEMLTEHF
jgi:hypothetical protein